MELTKDADKLCCAVYKKYLELRKSGISKINARHFNESFYKEIELLSNWTDDDVDETLNELKRMGFIKKYLDGGFQLQDDFIIYMENRFKNGILEVSDFIAKFIP